MYPVNACAEAAGSMAPHCWDTAGALGVHPCILVLVFANPQQDRFWNPIGRTCAEKLRDAGTVQAPSKTISKRPELRCSRLICSDSNREVSRKGLKVTEWSSDCDNNLHWCASNLFAGYLITQVGSRLTCSPECMAWWSCLRRVSRVHL